MTAIRPRTPLVPPEGALLRLPIDEERWAEHLPPVPVGYEVTASFSTELAAVEHGEALELLGYSVVGVNPRLSPVPSASLLVRQQLIEAHPTYWRSLAALSDAAYSLALGPPLALLTDVLALHAGVGR
jgi:hypothetical protein